MAQQVFSPPPLSDESSSPDSIDAELVTRSLRGESDAFAALFDRHAQRVYATAYGIIGDRTDAEDITQDAFLQALSALPTLRQGALFGPWVARIAANGALSTMRKRGRLPQAALSEAVEETYPDAARWGSPEAMNLAFEQQTSVQQALNRLTPSHRMALAMREIGGLSYAEMAQALGTSQGGVETLLFRARARFRTEYNKVTLGAMRSQPRLTCNETRRALVALADNELPDGQRSDVVAHVRGCVSCTTTLQGQRETQLLLLALPLTIPVSLKTGVMSKAAFALAAHLAHASAAGATAVGATGAVATGAAATGATGAVATGAAATGATGAVATGAAATGATAVGVTGAAATGAAATAATTAASVVATTGVTTAAGAVGVTATGAVATAAGAVGSSIAVGTAAGGVVSGGVAAGAATAAVGGAIGGVAVGASSFIPAAVGAVGAVGAATKVVAVAVVVSSAIVAGVVVRSHPLPPSPPRRLLAAAGTVRRHVHTPPLSGELAPVAPLLGLRFLPAEAVHRMVTKASITPKKGTHQGQHVFSVPSQHIDIIRTQHRNQSSSKRSTSALAPISARPYPTISHTAVPPMSTRPVSPASRGKGAWALSRAGSTPSLLIVASAHKRHSTLAISKHTVPLETPTVVVIVPQLPPTASVTVQRSNRTATAQPQLPVVAVPLVPTSVAAAAQIERQNPTALPTLILPISPSATSSPASPIPPAPGSTPTAGGTPATQATATATLPNKDAMALPAIVAAPPVVATSTLVDTAGSKNATPTAVAGNGQVGAMSATETPLVGNGPVSVISATVDLSLVPTPVSTAIPIAAVGNGDSLITGIVATSSPIAIVATVIPMMSVAPVAQVTAPPVVAMATETLTAMGVATETLTLTNLTPATDTATTLPVATATDLSTATDVPAATATATDLPTATATPTDTPTPTDTATDMATATVIPTDTATGTDTATPTDTATDVPTPTDTATDVPTPTDTVMAMPTNLTTAMDTATATNLPTATTTATATDLPTATATNLPTATDTATATDLPTATATATNLPTATDTATATDLPTATAEPAANAACPLGWICGDVGTSAVAGAQTVSNGIWTIQGGESTHPQQNHALHYIWRPFPLAAVMSTRVLTETSDAGAGLIVQQRLRTDVLYYAVIAEYSHVTVLLWRQSCSCATTLARVTVVQQPITLQIQRSGNLFSAALLSPETGWWTIPQSTQTMATAQSVMAGVGVMSMTPSGPSVAAIDSTTVTTDRNSTT